MEDDQQIRARAENDADPRVDLAVERTLLALERTQLAWVRTVIGLITAGIALDKGFEALHEARLMAGTAWLKDGHLGGLLLTSGGTLMMIFTTVLYILRTRELNLMRGAKTNLPTPGSLISLFICLIGALAIYFLTRPS
jgi:putative membrane protein